ncbi:MAG: phage primase, family [Clostridia bacterium]|nr:phage primase, family [Clostridia bacterium]
MFKGYIPTNNKRPTERVRGRNGFYSLEEVQHLHEYGGVLDDAYIMVDIDDMQQAKTLEKIVDDLGISCSKLYTTRGIHFYFKNTIVSKNSITKPLAIGLMADIKLGKNNAVVPLKIDGIERRFIAAECAPLPRWLQIVNNPPQFLTMAEGDGRNQEIFNYILKLQSHGFKKEEIKQSVLIINKYVLKRPLEETELDIILRDESFTAPTFVNEKGQLLLDDFCKYIKGTENMILLNNQLHVYHDGVYVPEKREIERHIIKHIPNCGKAKRSEIMAMLELICEPMTLSQTNYVVVKNGLLNIDTMQLEPFNTDIIITNKVDTNYNPDAKSTAIDAVLDNISCSDKDLRALIEEMIGYILLPRNELGKCFILTGDGANGKSTLLKCLKRLIGRHNISSLGLGELGEKFKTAELYGKLLNLGDDIGNGYIEDNSVFKKLVTGEALTVERKGADPFDFENYSKFIFAANDIPRINDTSNGLKRRLIIIPFNAKFDKNKDKYNPFIIDDLRTQEALEYLLLLGIDGLKRIMTRNEFTKVDGVDKVTSEYEKMNNPIIQFLEEIKIEDEPVSKAYDNYVYWCNNSGYKALSKYMFAREVNKRGFESKVIKSNGTPVRVYSNVV